MSGDGAIPTNRGVTEMNGRNRGRIPPNQWLIIAWGQTSVATAPRRSDAARSEGQLARTGRGRPQLPADVVPPAQHLVPDRGGGAGLCAGQLGRCGVGHHHRSPERTIASSTTRALSSPGRPHQHSTSTCTRCTSSASSRSRWVPGKSRARKYPRCINLRGSCAGLGRALPGEAGAEGGGIPEAPEPPGIGPASVRSPPSPDAGGGRGPVLGSRAAGHREPSR
jgi:hypothetical protein